MQERGSLYIISAPSGAGKTSLVNALVRSFDHVKLSVSYTTRDMRPGEKDNVNYHFIDKAEFKSHIKSETFFLEFAQVFGNYYGTGAAWVEKQLSQGFDVVLEIDWQGARQIRASMPQAVTVFVLPPSMEALEERLISRQRDDDATIAKRMAEAKNELEHVHEYEYVVINDEFETALLDLKSIVRSRRRLQAQQGEEYQHLLHELLANS